MKNLLKNELFIKVSKFVVAAALIGWMLKKGLIDLSVLSLMATPFYIAIALVFSFLNLAIANWRWTLLLQARGFSVPFSKTMPLTLIADFFNFALPGAIGGDVVKAYYIAQDHSQRKTEAVTSVIVDRVIGLYGMVVMALGTIVWNIGFVISNPKLGFVSLMVLGLFSIMTLFFAGGLSQRFRLFLRFDSLLPKIPGGNLGLKFYDAFQGYRSHPKLILVAIGLSLFAQLLAIVFMMFVGHAIGENNLGIDVFLFAVPLGFILSAVPISPGGIGVGQYAFLALFRMYSGTPTNLGQTAITAFQISLFAWGIVGGLLYLKKKKPNFEEVSV
ncbi:MAG: flippase-like domain-containing protein [Bdellovibrionales bacterium]|nr:flippase-like domain-containing protein [Bdellovibrionales bacterium]